MLDLLEGLPDEELVPARAGWDAAELAYLRENWRAQTAEQIAAYLPQRTRNSVCGMARRLGLPAKPKGPSRKGNPNSRVRKAFASKGDDATLSRWVKTGKPKPPTQADLLDTPRQLSPALLQRPEVVAGRSRFARKGVVPPPADRPRSTHTFRVLVSGHSNVKIGRDVRKGWLRGYWIYTLTLEERATCPRSCFHWATCYGNNMPFAARFDHRDPIALTLAIERDVQEILAIKGRAGMLVRLHALGDFFSPEYVTFWAGLLARHPKLAVYGYTAWPPDSPIGERVAACREHFGRRFVIRWSNGDGDKNCALPIRAVDEPVNAIVCPEQTGATAACATCGLCWGTNKNVAFIEH